MEDGGVKFGGELSNGWIDFDDCPISFCVVPFQMDNFLEVGFTNIYMIDSDIIIFILLK